MNLEGAAARSRGIASKGGPGVGEQLAIAALLPSAEEVADRAIGLGIDMDEDDALAIGHEARRVALETLEREMTPPNPIARFVKDAMTDPEVRDVWPPSRVGLLAMLLGAYRDAGEEPPDEPTCYAIVGAVFDAIVEVGEGRG